MLYRQLRWAHFIHTFISLHIISSLLASAASIVCNVVIQISGVIVTTKCRIIYPYRKGKSTARSTQFHDLSTFFAWVLGLDSAFPAAFQNLHWKCTGQMGGVYNRGPTHASREILDRLLLISAPLKPNRQAALNGRYYNGHFYVCIGEVKGQRRAGGGIDYEPMWAFVENLSRHSL
jgi:hypothetical protein